MARMIFEKSLHESVWAVYRDTASRSGNTIEAFGRALAVVQKARPEMAIDDARREVAAMIAMEPERTLSGQSGDNVL
jgi:hypothetical protein